jgi:hypothetical protein
MLTLVKVFDSCDQLPLGPHADVVGREKGVDDFQSQWRGKFEVLHGKANRGGALTNHADVCRCGEEVEEARARVLHDAEAQRQRIVVQLRNRESTVGHRKDKRPHPNCCRRRQAVKLDREPAELILTELQQQ